MLKAFAIIAGSCLAAGVVSHQLVPPSYRGWGFDSGQARTGGTVVGGALLASLLLKSMCKK